MICDKLGGDYIQLFLHVFDFVVCEVNIFSKAVNSEEAHSVLHKTCDSKEAQVLSVRTDFVDEAALVQDLCLVLYAVFLWRVAVLSLQLLQALEEELEKLRLVHVLLLFLAEAGAH